VWIERLEIEGFRSLAGTFEFSRGLTIVVGDNESGKSSLHDALVRTLFGYSKTERRRSRGSSPLERRAPWDGSPYRLVGIVHTDDRDFRIEWDFATHRVKLLDELGHDVSGDVLAKGDEVELGTYLLGVDLDDFRQVCCIDQDGLLAVRHSPSLGVALQEAVANVAGETPVEDALLSLDNFLRTVVGARVDNLNPSPTGRLANLARQRNLVRSELESAEAAREKLVEVSRDLAKARVEHDVLLAEHEGAKQRKLQTELKRLNDQLAEARRLDVAARDRPEQPQGLDTDAIDAVRAARDHASRLAEQIAQAESEAEAVSDEVSRLEGTQRELVAAVDGLAPYAGVDGSSRDRVQTAAAQLSGLDSPEGVTAGVLPGRDPLLQEFRAERASLRSLSGQGNRSQSRKVVRIAFVVLTIGIGWALLWAIQRIRGARPGSLEERLAHFGGVSIDELEARVAEEDRRVAVAEGILAALADTRAAAEKQRGDLEEELDAALDAVNAPVSPRETRVQAYLVAVERHHERTEYEAALGRVQHELALARRPQDELTRLRGEVVRADRKLRDAYSAVEINPDDLESAERDFDALMQAEAREKARERDAGAAATALQSVLADDSLETLEMRRTEAERAVQDSRTKHGDLAGELGNAENPTADLDALVRAHVQRLAELETLAKQLEGSAGDPAELKEKLAEFDAQIERLDEAKKAVALARRFLNEAAAELRREFAPHLNQALKKNLARLTGGRYADAMVDAGLGVSVVVPETGKLQSADELSRATKDQIFLVERLEIARLLAPTKGRAPLLLDDPFARYDRGRLRHGLEVLAEAATERQIVVFSEDPDLAGHAREVCQTCHVIELAPPTARTSPTAA
jgi:DNA repair exonuclease SbcCD ATPase subunit